MFESGKIPLYFKIENYIREKIDSDVYKKNEVIPSERELASKFNVTRMTVRQAVSNLVNEGKLYRIRGKGTFVSEEKMLKGNTGLTSFTEDMLSKGIIPNSKLLSFEVIKASFVIAEKLGISEGDFVFKIARLRLAGFEPISYEIIIRPFGITPNLIYRDFEGNVSLFKQLEDHGFTIHHAVQGVESVRTYPETANLLNILENDPLLLVRSVLYSENNKPLQYSKSYYRGDKFNFVQTVYRDN